MSWKQGEEVVPGTEWSAVSHAPKLRNPALRSGHWDLQQEVVHSEQFQWSRMNGNAVFALENVKHKDSLRKVNVGFMSCFCFSSHFNNMTI